ncbi:hypothetical protein B0H10DRAFT_2068202 [Mycena sp. CBHHK59/15]|nr:hypothetical protein B0H10DRAFT_2068202 [Mycena sp. CBHHK59/15]
MLGIDGQGSLTPLRPLILFFIGIASLFIVKNRAKLRLHLPGHYGKTNTIHGNIRISRILVYPIKSCAGIDLSTSAYDREGFEFDRKWMIVDLEKKKQLSARDNRGIKLVRAFPLIKRDPSSPTGGVLEVTFPDSPDTASFAIPLNPTEEQLRTWETHTGFDLWGAPSEGYVVESASAEAFETPSEILSSYVGRPVLLVMKTSAPRPLADDMPFDHSKLSYEGGSTVRYPDFSPFLIVSNASLEDAQAKVWAMARGKLDKKEPRCAPEDASAPTNAWAREDAKKLLIERFRPNVVVSGVDEAFGEDDWQELATVDSRKFILPARCPRCMFPNVDTETGLRDPVMPNNAMMQYRKVEATVPAKYCFGMYMVPVEDNGVLSVGDQILVTRSAVNPKLVSA